MGSKRFPGKIFKKIKNFKSIELQIKRLKKSKKISKLVVATSNSKKDLKLTEFLKKNKILFYRSDEKNVLKRFFETSNHFISKNIIRITADCPFIDPEILDKIITKFEKSNVDYAGNIAPPTFPNGMDVEIFNRESLVIAYKEAKTMYDKEHVTPYIIRSKKFKKINIFNERDFSNIRLTLDYKKDLKNLNFIAKKFNNIYFKLHDLLNLPFEVLPKEKKKTDFTKEKILWDQAQKKIVNGNMLLSKSPNVFLPDGWPTYYSSAKKCYVWDINNKKFLDFSTMGVGTNLLGYKNYKVDHKVNLIIKKSNMSTLNCPEEVELANKLLDISPGMEKVKFAKTGAEANSIAIRAARAFTNSSKIAVCGYHGWHDWYLAANLKNKKTLNELLINNLKIKGVPKELSGITFAFKYNDFEDFKKTILTQNIRIVKMEVMRNEYPKNNFLKKIRSFCNKNKIILIFDECTSGFRETYGGLYKKFKIVPDILILGKALGNGYPITAVLGKSDIMDSLQDSFVSSTFWTDRIGVAAAIATLDEMKRIQSWRRVTMFGLKIRKMLIDLSKKHKVVIKISGIPALVSFSFMKNNNLYKTYITEKMLENKILASNIVYPSTCHNSLHLKKYFKVLDKIFFDIKNYEDGDYTKIKLNSILSQPSFGRLN